MKKPFLPPDDLPPAQIGQVDSVLRRQLEASLSKRFYESCNGTLQALLTHCEWYITTRSGPLTLVVFCPNSTTNWRVLNNIVMVSDYLEPFSKTAKIRICPPLGTGAPFVIRVDEVSVYRDSL
jgi:hypothetical protein